MMTEDYSALQQHNLGFCLRMCPFDRSPKKRIGCNEKLHKFVSVNTSIKHLVRKHRIDK